MASYNIISKIEVAYNKWRMLQKNCSRRSEPQMQKQQEFSYDLDNLFDIAYANAMEIMKIDEDIQFLAGQRQRGRIGYMAGVDNQLTNLEARRAERQSACEKKKNIEKQSRN
jgi:uncharacterized sporulation protein YeaH/YhbH (DUF444 family)